MSELGPIYRQGALSRRDYEDAIELLKMASRQNPGEPCSVCDGPDHESDTCHHNPLAMARRSLVLRPRFRVVSAVDAEVSRLRKSDTDVRSLIQAASRYFGVTHSNILGGRKTKMVARARRSVIWLAKRRLDRSYPDIARELRMHHSSCVVAVQTIENERELWVEDLDATWAIAVSLGKTSMISNP